MNVWRRSIWRGDRYPIRPGRSFVLDAHAWIFRCPMCEYGMTAHTREGIDTIRRTHVRVTHVAQVAELAAADTIDALPRHLRVTP